MAELGAGGVSSFPGATPGAPYPQYFGIFFGVVNNNNDPLKKNRCLLQVPQLFGTAVTTWAISLTPLQTPPKVGTVITALFIGGDVDYPVYLVTDPQIVVESVAGNIKPIGTASSAGTSTKLAAADHVHGNISTLASDMQSDGTAAPGASGRLADAQHVHPEETNPTFANVTVTGTMQAASVLATSTLGTPSGYAINSVATPSIISVPHNPNDPHYGGAGGNYWLTNERLALNNQIDNINSNFSAIIGALQSAGILH